MRLIKFFGIQSASSADEKILSTLGSLISILLIFYISEWCTGFHGAMAILPSMGATAVLLFVLPHGTLSQPWPLFGGHLASATVGVTCALYIQNMYFATATSVAASIGLMHILRCMHPPGGATAIAAILLNEALDDFNYWFLVFPTLLNCFVIFTCAILFNNMFSWRRYPSSLMRYQKSSESIETKQITVEHIQQAIDTLHERIDIEPEQIKYIVDKADEIMLDEKHSTFEVELEAFYTNGGSGVDWSVRQVIDVSAHENRSKYMIIYRTVEGSNKNRSGSCSLNEFSNWAKEKMVPVSKKTKP